MVWHVLDEAAAKGHVDIVELAFGYAKEESYSGPRSSSTMSSAIAGGHIDIVRLLLCSASFDWDNKEEDFAEAVKLEQTEIAYLIFEEDSPCNIDTVDFLLATGRVSSTYFGKALKAAAENGSLEAVQNLYNKGRASTQALNKAFEEGGIDIVKFLDHTKKIRPTFCAAYTYRSKHNSEVVKFLYKHTCISSEMIDKAFEMACEGNDRDLVKLLLDDNRLSSDGIVKGFERAVANVSRDVLEILRCKEEISPAVIQKAYTRDNYGG
ncbi:hypothetical protein PHMEG_00031978 [Phytophthora megakarya]|uniref:Uncharacterized protein n=1 Tax=Phytophthora megakarya TaxID=4795 RepID=A0A225UXC4_9STRA|nr:hypothetical protein PHMEG_00031978 [Phytophthora megakarya]